MRRNKFILILLFHNKKRLLFHTDCSATYLSFPPPHRLNLGCIYVRDGSGEQGRIRPFFIGLLLPRLREGIDISQAVGLDILVDLIHRRRIQETAILQKRAVVSFQEDDEDELRRMSEVFSRASSERAHTVAVRWVAMD